MPVRILLCVDGSSFSDAASAIALQLLAALDGATLTVVHVVNVIAPTGKPLQDLKGRLGFEPAVVNPEVAAKHDADGKLILDVFGKKAADAGYTVNTVLEHGAVGERIVHHARHADLLVIGLRGATEDRHPGQGGSALNSILDQITIPAMFVPRGAKRIGAMAIGYDGSVGAAHAVSALRLIAPGLGVPIHAIYVSDDGADGAAVLDELDRELGQDTYRHIVRGDHVHTVLARAAVEAGADLIALGFKGKSPLGDFFFGTATEFILNNTKLVVLVAH